MKKLSKLVQNLSDAPRLPENIDQFLEDNYFYYFPKYPLTRLNHIPGAAENYLPDYNIRHLYINLDYKMIRHQGYSNGVIHGMSKLSNFLITSMDQKGIVAPLNLYGDHNIHPGNKRLICARYLNLEYIPILWQTTLYIPGLRRVSSLQDIYDIYGKNISIKLCPKENQKDRLEISWHGESKRRDPNGYDNWYETSKLRTDFNVPSYFLEHGLEIVNSTTNTKLFRKQSYPFNFTTTRKQKISIEILDDSLLDEDLDFWELFFHIDPMVYTKTCKTKKIKIINDYANNNITLTDCNLYNTLKRKKLYYD